MFKRLWPWPYIALCVGLCEGAFPRTFRQAIDMSRLSADKIICSKKRIPKSYAAQPSRASSRQLCTAKRYYELWSAEIKRSLEAKLLPSLEESVKHTRKRTGKV